MKFAILADIHLGPEEYYNGILRKVNKDAKKILADFIEEMSNNTKPEFVVVLGDLIEDDGYIKDKININYVIQLFKKIRCPVYYVAGNHDLKNIPEDELTKLFHQKNLYYSFNSGNYHFITLYSKRSKNKNYFYISEEQKDWLKNDLDKTDKKCIVFVHHSLADQDLTGNPWFEGKPNKCLIANREEIRNILSASKKILAVFNSHLHWDRQNVHENIPYFTIQSLVENEDNKGIASETHAVVNIINDRVDVEIKGNYSKNFSYKLCP